MTGAAAADHDPRDGADAVTPETSTPTVLRATNDRDVRDIVRQAHDGGIRLRIMGRGTWLHGGYPVSATRALDVSALAGIIEYVPGDLTLTAAAGTTLAEIGDATRRHGQWLALDPFGDDHGTLGATLATASCGPLGASVGLPRDVVVGLAFVSGDGQLIHGGGRVVKNVAGFDLVRPTIGAWGTLGVIVSATVRLRARPMADETVRLSVPDESTALARFLAALRQAPIEPLATELISAPLARRLGFGDASTLLVRLGGNRVSVEHQRQALSRLGDAVDAAPDVWSALQRSDPGDACIVRVSRRPTELARLWGATIARSHAEAHASVARGVVRLRLHHGPTAGDLNVYDRADTIVLEQHPPGDAPLPAPGTVPDELTRRIRMAFDPAHILNPGILGASGT